METDFLKWPIAVKMAIISFTIGTFLFGLFFAFKNLDEILIIGFFYVMSAITINGIMLLKLVYDWITQQNKRKTIEKQTIILLANIPVAITYLFIIIYSITSNSSF
ncbi:MAG TPA: hypothetical protein VK164_11830 [Flavobacterium sp.]|uniref:hypothetical protein n=1 Tax=Flavobacterium sp. TaxID=239 RepID=UPI002B4B4B57|nr:hypothetical protein [Flavobacterium sp.]HLO74619.1 hypothetical protein [Flavobacterium sp.]